MQVAALPLGPAAAVVALLSVSSTACAYHAPVYQSRIRAAGVSTLWDGTNYPEGGGAWRAYRHSIQYDSFIHPLEDHSQWEGFIAISGQLCAVKTVPGKRCGPSLIIFRFRRQAHTMSPQKPSRRLGRRVCKIEVWLSYS